MDSLKDIKLFEEIKQLFQDNPEALDFMLAYNDYGHLVDDIIDENGSFREILKMDSLACALWSSPFWIKYGNQLFLVQQLINNQYTDSVEWESSSEKWMVEDARCLSHAGYNMMFAIILLLKGRDTLRNISSRWRERAHRMHLLGMPDVKKEDLEKLWDITKECSGCHKSDVVPVHKHSNGSWLCGPCARKEEKEVTLICPICKIPGRIPYLKSILDESIICNKCHEDLMNEHSAINPIYHEQVK